MYDTTAVEATSGRERDVRMVFDDPFDFQGPLADPQPGVSTKFDDFLSVYQEICDSDIHQQLQVDLVAHLWAIDTFDLDYQM